MSYRIGDKIVKISGDVFSDGRHVATIASVGAVARNGQATIWMSIGTNTMTDKVRHATQDEIAQETRPIPIGAIVTLSPQSDYFGDGRNNPAHPYILGTRVEGTGGAWDRVEWPDGRENSYRPRDLIVHNLKSARRLELMRTGDDAGELRFQVEVPLVPTVGVWLRDTLPAFEAYGREAATANRPATPPPSVFTTASSKRAPKPPAIDKNVKRKLTIQGTEYTFSQDELRALEAEVSANILE